MKADLLIHSLAQLATPLDTGQPAAGPQQGAVWLLADAAVAIAGGRIVAVGSSSDLLGDYREAERLDGTGKTLVPGWCDAHTHALYAGDRAAEFALRLAGASYLEIMAAGGGIEATVQATRATSDHALRETTRARLRRMLEHGTTTVEVKSGYGLSLADELRCLRILRDLGVDATLPRIVPTFLGAHAIPRTHKGRAKQYVDLIVAEMLPAVAAEGLAVYCDVFCDVGAFDVAQSRRILLAARELGLRPRLHANEFANIGAASLAAEVGAVSADHLLLLSNAEIVELRESGCVAVLAPGTPYGLGLRDYAPARRMVEGGLPIALASDCNPGTCPCESLPLVISLACTQMRLSPAEALTAATLNAAYALELAVEIGSIEVGKWADLVLLDAPSYLSLAYQFGNEVVAAVLKGGVLVSASSR